MDSLSLTFAVGFNGEADGISGNPDLSTPLVEAFSTLLSGSGKQAYVATLTVAANTTTTLNLLTGLTNPLGEAISGAPFAHVYGVIVQHAVASLASSITAFGGGSNDFQGYKSAGATEALPPGAWQAFGIDATKTGMVVDATHKNIAIRNTDMVNAATVAVAVFGKTT